MTGMSRRDFLKVCIWGGSAAVATALIIPSAGYFLSPAWKEVPEEWIPIGEAGAIPLGKPMQVEFVDRRKDGWMTVEKKQSAWILTRDGKNFVAFDPYCTHLGCPYRWDEKKEQFLCPCHAAVFDLDGNVISGPPPRPLDQYAVRTENGKLWVKPVVLKKESV